MLTYMRYHMKKLMPDSIDDAAIIFTLWKQASPESQTLPGDSYIYFFLAFWLATTTLFAFSSTARTFFLSSRIRFMSSAL